MKFLDSYDIEIVAASATYLMSIDWRLLKAQYYAESRLNPNAKSPVGAAGIAQFMPRTWEDIARQLGFPVYYTPYDVQHAIIAGAFYMKQLRQMWTRPEISSLVANGVDEIHKFALASYNAGGGNIRKAWRLAGRKAYWSETAPFLIEVTGKHAEETVTYVARILKYFEQMKADA